MRNSLGAPDGSLRRTYLSAILNNLANPKVVLFFLAFVPQFITPGGWATSTQILVLGGVLIVIGIIVDCAVGVAAGTFSAILRARPAMPALAQAHLRCHLRRTCRTPAPDRRSLTDRCVGNQRHVLLDAAQRPLVHGGPRALALQFVASEAGVSKESAVSILVQSELVAAC